MLTPQLWYQNRTVWAGVVVLLAMALKLSGIELLPSYQQEIIDSITLVATGIGGVATIYFRIRREHEIKQAIGTTVQPQVKS